MKESLSNKLYGMKDPPDGIIVFPDETYIVLSTIITFSHNIYNTSALLDDRSKVIFSESLLNKDILDNLQRLSNDFATLYLFIPIRNRETSKDEWICCKLNNVRLIDFKFGTATDGEPSHFTYTFKGDLIEQELNTEIRNKYLDILKKETQYKYE